MTRLVGLIAVVLLTAGCGAEYTAGYRNVASSVPAEFRNTPAQYPRDGAANASFSTHTITFLDRTGILLAVLGSVSNAMDARAKAIKEARLRGQTRGKVYYTYATTPIVPGFDLRLSYTWGGTTGFDLNLNDQPLSFSNNDVKFSEMHMRLDFWTKPFRFRGSKLYFGIAWTPRITSIDFESTPRDPLSPASRTLDLSVLYFPVEASLAYLVSPRLRLTAGLEYDPITGLIDVLGLDVHQSFGVHARAEFMILPWLFAYSRLDWLRGSDGSSQFLRQVNQTVLGVGLSFQVPLRGK